MKRAAAIVTNRGGRTCHAAIIARELGIPGGRRLRRRDQGAQGRRRRSPSPAPKATPGTSTRACSRSKWPTSRSTACRRPPTKIMMNVGNPELAFGFSKLPNEGVGPRAARVHHQPQHRRASRRRCSTSMRCRRSSRRRSPSASPATPTRSSSTSRKIAEGVATIAAAFWPKKVIVRLSDFKSNEYSNLARGRALRAARRESDDRLPRRVALHRAGVLRLLRAGMRGAQARARRDGLHQRRGHGAVRAHARGGRAGDRAAGEERSRARPATACASS